MGPKTDVRQFDVLPHSRQSLETMTSVSAGHIMLTNEIAIYDKVTSIDIQNCIFTRHESISVLRKRKLYHS